MSFDLLCASEARRLIYEKYGESISLVQVAQEFVFLFHQLLEEKLELDQSVELI